jgi:predicted O-linked N-acetylglucosamine transferase (SPINDLY family)
MQATPRLSTGRARKAELAWVRGQQHVRQGRWPEALPLLREARRLLPGDPLFGLNLAQALIKTGQWNDALAELDRVDCEHPGLPIARRLRITTLVALRKNEELVQILESTPEADMDKAMWIRLGVARVQLGQAQSAVGAFLRALALEPSDASVHYRLGLTFNELALKAEAAECLRTALLLDLGPLEAGVRDLLAYYEREVCNWPESEPVLAALKDSIAKLPDGVAIQTNPFAHVTLLDDPVLQLKGAAASGRFYSQAIQPMPPRAVRRRDRVRIGYVSADIRKHATSFLMVQLLERHDRGRFEVTLYSYGKEDDSEVSQRIRGACEHFVSLRGMSAAQIARRMREDSIDIAVDLKGYTRDGMPAIFAARPAPVQVAYLGYPGTTGAQFIDYIVGDPFVTPMTHAHHFTEKIAQLPSCYQCNDGARALPGRPQRGLYGLPEDALVFCGFNQPYKISPQVMDVWCRLLQRMPGSVIWLMEWNRSAPSALRREASARGIDPSRLIFANTLPQVAHLERTACADIFLDTWPCNAHTTASDALWAGLPLVTYSGRTFASRVAGSLLNAIDMPDTVCDSVEAYEAKVLELAHDQDKRLAIRRHTEAARLTSPLFSGARIARDIEDLYTRMWERALAGLPPEHLPALQVS